MSHVKESLLHVVNSNYNFRSMSHIKQRLLYVVNYHRNFRSMSHVKESLLQVVNYHYNFRSMLHVKERFVCVFAVPYALDEPTLPPHVTLSVQGGTVATYNLHSTTAGEQLCYENFLYIAFTGTFTG